MGLDSVKEVDDILKRIPQELDHVRAFQANLECHRQMDDQLDRAIAKRNDALRQIERYRKGLAARVRGVSDELIEAEYLDGVADASLVP